MPVDASIPLQVQRPRLMTPADALSLQNLVQTNQMEALQLAKARKSEQDRELILRVMSTPDAYDEDGVVSLNTIRRLGTLSPELSFKAANEREHVMRERSAAQSRFLQDTSNAQVLTARFTAQVDKLHEDARAAVQDLVAAGAPPAAIDTAFKQKRKELIKNAIDSGAFGYLPKDPIQGVQLPTQDQVASNLLAYDMGFTEATARARKPEGIAEDQRKAEQDRRATEAAQRDAARLRLDEERLRLQRQKEEREAKQSPITGKVPAEIQRQQLALRSLQTGLDAYEKMLGEIDPRSRDQLSPSKQARVKAMLSDLVISWKEAAALGALTGPDVAIIEKALADPLSVKGAWYGREGLLGQVEESRKSLQRRMKALEDQYGVSFPEPSQPAAPEGGPQKPAPKVTAPRAAAPKSALPRVKSVEEARKLPKGTRFIDPNGVERIR